MNDSSPLASVILPMKFAQMGKAMREPVAPDPMGVGSSKPTHTPPQKLGVNPQNQALVLLFVVPVLPAPVLVNPLQRALTAVPSVTVVLSRLVIM